jgi:heme oxygenase
MAYPQAFLDMERETETRGKRSLVSRMLQRRFGELPAGVQLAIESLSYEQVDRLGEALLDFQNLADLRQWIDQFV